MGWLRILESWTTDRLHTGGSATTTQQFATSAGATTSPIVTLDDATLATNYSREEIKLLFDHNVGTTLVGLRSKTSLAFIGQAVPLSGPFETAGLNRNTALAGVSYRWKQKLTTSADVESAPGNHTYFRTSLYNYSYARVRARYQALPTLELNATFYELTNSNPSPLIGYQLTSRPTSAGLNWLPNGGRRVSIPAEYTRRTTDSHIFYLIPSTLQRATSIYRDKANTGVALIDMALPDFKRLRPRVSIGGTLYHSVGFSDTVLSAFRSIPGRLQRALFSVRGVAPVRHDPACVFDPRVPLQSDGLRGPSLTLAWYSRTPSLEPMIRISPLRILVLPAGARPRGPIFKHLSAPRKPS